MTRRGRETVTREEAERHPERLAFLVPDEPRWLPLRGLLLSGRCRVFTEPIPEHGFIARSVDYPLAATAFSPSLGLLQWTLAMRGTGGKSPSTGPLELLVPSSSAAWWGKRLTRWRELEVVVLTLPEAVIGAIPTGPPGAEHDASVTCWGAGGDDRPGDDDLPEEVRRELRFLLDRGKTVTVARSEGQAASFCHAPFETESLWDVAVYTVSGQRRKGLARAAFAAMARRQLAAGRRPVWSAYTGNEASLTLARELGFVPEGRLAAFRKPR